MDLPGWTFPRPRATASSKQTAFRLDGIAEPPDAPRGYAEVQFHPDEGFHLRFFTEILPHLGQYPSASPKPWRVALIIAETGNIAPIVRKVREHGENNPGGRIDWLDLLETVPVYKLPKFTREAIKQMLGVNDVEPKKTRFYQDVFGEDREEGRLQGGAALLLRLMERKFRPLPESARKRVAEADAETLLLCGGACLTPIAGTRFGGIDFLPDRAGDSAGRNRQAKAKPQDFEGRPGGTSPNWRSRQDLPSVGCG